MPAFKVKQLVKTITLSLLFMVFASTFLGFAGCEDSSIPANESVKFEDTRPNGTKVTLEIGANTFPDNMDGDLDANDPIAEIDQAAFEAATGTEAVDYPVVLHFSALQAVKDGGKLELTIELPSAIVQQAENEDKKLYAMTKTEGDAMGPLPEEQRRWHEAIGNLWKDPTTSKVFMTIPLYATGETMTVVVVRGEGLGVIDTPAFAKRSRRAVLRSAGTGPFDLPWVVLCVGEFSSAATCSNTAGGNSPAQQVLKILTDDAAWLKGKGWTKAKYRQGKLSAFSKLAKTYSLTLLSDTAPEGTGPKVNLALFREGRWCGTSANPAVGCYHPDTGIVEYSLSALDPANRSINGAGDTIVHELFHGVQLSTVPQIFSKRENNIANLEWIYEGTAAAMGIWRLANENAVQLLGARRFNRWRNWEEYNPLNSDKGSTPYETFEWWAITGGGNLDYIRLVFEKITGFSNKATSYETINRIFKDTIASDLRQRIMNELGSNASLLLYENLSTEEPLALGYLSTVAHRTPNDGYPHCWLSYDFEEDHDSPPYQETFFSMTLPLSSECMHVKSVNHFAKFGESCLKVSVIPHGTEATNAKMAFVVSGAAVHNEYGDKQNVAYAGESLFVQSDEADIQVVDLDMMRERKAGNSRQLAVDVKVEIDDRCGVPVEETETCYNTEVVCGSEGCGLWMESPDGECWVKLAKCDKGAARCKSAAGTSWKDMDWGVCHNTATVMQNFQDGDELATLDPQLPAHKQCGTMNFCRRIILCGS